MAMVQSISELQRPLTEG